MQSVVKAFFSISVETAGSQKMPQWKVILLFLWKVRVLIKFRDRMQQSVSGKFGKSFVMYICENCGLSKNGSAEIGTSISVETAGSQKIP